MSRPASRVTSVAALVLVVIGSVIGVGMNVSPAGAHGGAAEISVLAQTPTGPLGVDFRVQVAYVLDQHPAVPATFEVSAVSSDGTQVPSTSLVATLETGVYEVGLEFPASGTWEVVFTSSLPPGELIEQVAVGDVPQPTALPGESDGDGAVEGPTLVASEGSSVPTMLLVGVVIAGLVAVAVLVLIVRAVGRGRRTSTPTPPATGGAGRSR